MTLNPDYRVMLKKNVASFPGFIDFLKYVFKSIITNSIMQAHIEMEQVYRFSIFTVPVTWRKSVEQILFAKAELIEKTPKLQKILEILDQLDPLSPQQPVEMEFTLSEIVSFVTEHVCHFQEPTQFGMQDYFGIPLQMWFDDFPIQTGTVIRAVDYGTQENHPWHLFDAAFAEVRANVLDYFAMFIKGKTPLEMGLKFPTEGSINADV